MTLPEEWKITCDYDSHKPLLYCALQNNKECHPVAEFGSGFGSTFLLREYCQSHGMKFETWDTDKEWCLQTGATFVESCKNISLPMGYIIFIDSKPGEERKDLIKNNKYKYILIIHDTEEGALDIYGIRDVLKEFKFRLDFKPEGAPGTTAVSNSIDVSKWIIPE